MAASKFCLSLLEVDTALSEIESKYNKNNYSEESVETTKFVETESTSSLINKLYEQFDCLGIPIPGLKIESDARITHKTVQQLISSVFILMHRYRTEINRTKDVNVTVMQTEYDRKSLQQKVDSSKRQMAQMENAIQTLNTKIHRIEYECNSLQNENKTLKQKLYYTKKITNMKEAELQHQQKKLFCENMKLQDKFKGTIGQHVSQDEVIATCIGTYKMNEEIYKSTIKKLQDNNTELLKEISTLKQELLNYYLNK